MSKLNKNSSSITWLVVKCGITTLAGIAWILLLNYYPDEFANAGFVAMDAVSVFFGLVFGYIGRAIAFIASIPMVAILVLGGLYAWGVCVCSKLKKRNQKCEG